MESRSDNQTNEPSAGERIMKARPWSINAEVIDLTKMKCDGDDRLADVSFHEDFKPNTLNEECHQWAIATRDNPKTTRFLSTDISSSHPVLSYKDYTIKEITRCWYTSKDVDKFLRKGRNLANKEAKSSTQEDAEQDSLEAKKKNHDPNTTETFSGARRGLEHQTIEGRKVLSKVIEQNIKAVMDEQWSTGSTYKELPEIEARIALASRESSAGSVVRAISAATKDEEAAAKVYLLEKSIYFNNMLEKFFTAEDEDFSDAHGSTTDNNAISLGNIVATTRKTRVRERKQNKNVSTKEGEGRSLSHQKADSLRPSLEEYLESFDQPVETKSRSELRGILKASCLAVQLSNYLGQKQTKSPRSVTEEFFTNSQGESLSSLFQQSLDISSDPPTGIEEEMKDDYSEPCPKSAEEIEFEYLASRGYDSPTNPGKAYGNFVSSGSFLTSATGSPRSVVFRKSSLEQGSSFRCSAQNLLKGIKSELSEPPVLKEFTEKQRAPLSAEFQTLMLEEAMKRDSFNSKTSSGSSGYGRMVDDSESDVSSIQSSPSMKTSQSSLHMPMKEFGEQERCGNNALHQDLFLEQAIRKMWTGTRFLR